MTATVPAKREPTIDLFFAFADGVYDYVCAECTALCCKGHGLGGSLERELRTLFVRYPQMETMAISRNGDQITLATTGSGCVMLDTDNFCRIEKELGKDKKPNICNLFPFNAFTRVGKTIVVTPHFLCPLRAVVPARPGQVRGTHAFIEADIRQSRMLNREYVKGMVTVAQTHPSAGDTAIERERTFRDLCANSLGKERFRDVLLSASADPVALSAFAKRARHLMGYEALSRAEQRDEIDDMLLAFASPYRIGLLGLTAEGILRALMVGEIIARRAWLGATITPTFQGLANTLATFRPIQFLLAWGDETFDFGKVLKKTFSFLDPDLTFAAFITVNNAPMRGPLAALEQAIPASMSIADRSVLMIRLGELMQIGLAKRKGRYGVVIDKILSVQDRGQVTSSLVSAVG